MESIENAVVETESAVTEEQVAVAPEESLEEGSNESVLAEQTSEPARAQDSSTNRAFQQMRKANEEMQRELEELRAEKQARETTYSRFMGDSASDFSVIAEASGVSEDEIRATYNASKAELEKERYTKELEEEVIGLKAEIAMAGDLNTLRKLDPNIKDLSDLGESYVNYVKAGLSAEDAYWAVKSKETANRATPPKEIGKIETSPIERETFTDAEIKSMSSEELTRNWKKILKSWER